MGNTKKASNNSKQAAPKQRTAKAKKQRSVPRVQEVTQSAPVATSTKSRGRQPQISYRSDGMCCTVSHRERIGTVLGSVAFTATDYAINPGLVESFPWLSAIANRFESYRFKSLTFHYKTKTATTAVGDVILVTDYDAADSAPTSSIQAESYQAYADCAPWQNQSMGASRQNLEKFPQRYTRDTAIPSNTDIKTYDVGNFYICTENQASTALVGYLYVEYTVELFTPQLRSSDFYISGGSFVGGGTQSAANPLGSAPTTNASARGVSLDTTSTLTIANPGSYLVTTYVGGTTVSAVVLAAVAGCTVSSYWGTVVNSASTAGCRVNLVVVSSFNATLTVTATAAAVSASTYLAVASIPVGAVSTMFRGDIEDFVMIGDSDKALTATQLRERIVTCTDPAVKATLMARFREQLLKQ